MNAFVLSGAGNRGAMEAGALIALFEAGIRPDLVTGSSSGAINAAHIAADPSLEGAGRLASIWRGIRKGDIFPGSSLSALWRLSRRRDRLYEATGLERVIRTHLPYRNLEEAAVPVILVATDLATGRERWFDHGDAVRAILASAALPGVFPPVEIDGARYIDGGVVDRVPISVGVERGADAIYVVDAGFPCESQRPYRSAADIVLQAVGVMGTQRLRSDLERYGATYNLVYLPLPCHLSLWFTDFSHTDELVRDGYLYARRALAGSVTTPAWLEGSLSPGSPATTSPGRARGDPSRQNERPNTRRA